MEQEKSAVKKRLTLFVALTFVITWIIFMLIPFRGLTYEKGVSIYIVMAGMFVPALCSILTRLITKEGFGNMYLRPHFKGHMKDYLLVYFGPSALLLLIRNKLYRLSMAGDFGHDCIHCWAGSYRRLYIHQIGKRNTCRHDSFDGERRRRAPDSAVAKRI